MNKPNIMQVKQAQEGILIILVNFKLFFTQYNVLTPESINKSCFLKFTQYNAS